MSISIICPLYNAEHYVEKLNTELIKQKEVTISEIKYILTNTGDGTEKILKRIGADYEVIDATEFSHSLTREKAAIEAIGEIIIFITQDIIIRDDLWLKKLTKDIYEGNCAASFSRQICENNTIEKYTRINNYPKVSRVVSKDDIQRLGIMTFFFSDAASAVSSSVYRKLNGYDGKDLLTNEDMYLAYKLIQNGYKIKYCAEAEIYHSHDYKFKQLMKRYFDQGVFLKQNSYLMEYGANSSAVSLLLFIIKEAAKEMNFKVLFNIVPNFAARFIGNKLGQNYSKLAQKTILKYTSNRGYWMRNNV